MIYVIVSISCAYMIGCYLLGWYWKDIKAWLRSRND